MSRIALLSSEPVRPRMAGIGIRYLELARRLPAAGFETVLISPASREESAAAGLAPEAVRPFGSAPLPELVRDCARRWRRAARQRPPAGRAGAAGGDRPLRPVARGEPPLHGDLGLDPYRNDHTTWVLQMARGDFFLCSSEEQRLYYLGFLTALGRVNPERLGADSDLRALVDTVPFGLPATLPAHRPVLPACRPGERHLLFGGLYDWYDPFTLMAALARLEGHDWTLWLVRNPNPEGTPQRLFAEVEADCRRRGWWGGRVRMLDWIAAERRYDLLRDADLLVAPHHPTLETRLALRTRFLEALAVGCPVGVSEGGAIARMVSEARAGWVVLCGDEATLRRGARRGCSRAGRSGARRERGERFAAAFGWERALAPLVRFLTLAAERSDEGAVRLPAAHRGSRRPLRLRLRRWLDRSHGDG